MPSYGWIGGSLPATTMPSSTVVPLKLSASLKPFSAVELPGSPSHATIAMRPSMFAFGILKPSGFSVTALPRKYCKPSNTFTARNRSLAEP